MSLDTRNALLSVTLADHVAKIRLQDLPAETVAATKLTMLDSLACGWAATGAPGAAEAMAMALGPRLG